MAKLKMTITRMFTLLVASLTGLASTSVVADDEPKTAGKDAAKSASGSLSAGAIAAAVAAAAAIAAASDSGNGGDSRER